MEFGKAFFHRVKSKDELILPPRKKAGRRTGPPLGEMPDYEITG
jgi:hypothetical protein